MTTEHSKQPGLPAHRYAQHVDALTSKPDPRVTFGQWALLIAGSLLAGIAFGWAF